MKILFALLVVVASVLGLLNASYITWSEMSGHLPPCRPPFACDDVLASPWSHVGSIPLSIFGMIFYGIVAILAALIVLEVPKIFRLKTSLLLLLVGSLGMTFSLYLVFVMGTILHAWCLYCLFSAIDCAIVFLLSTVVWRKDSHEVHV